MAHVVAEGLSWTSAVGSIADPRPSARDPRVPHFANGLMRLARSRGFQLAFTAVLGVVALVMAVVLFLPDGLVSIGRRARRMRLIRQYIRRARKERKEDAPARADREVEETTQ